MPGMFDDLIPAKATPTGMFDDLAPGAKAAPVKPGEYYGGDAAPWSGLEDRAPEAESLKAASEYRGPSNAIKHGSDYSFNAALSGIPVAGAFIAPETSESQAWEAQHPKQAKIAKAIGSIAGTAPLIAAAPGWFGASAAQSLPARALWGAIGGGAISGADTLARTGDPEKALESARIGAEWGGAAPLVMEPAINALGMGASFGSRVINSIVPGTRINVENRLLTALGRQNMTPADLDAWEARAQDAGQFPGNSNPIPVPTVLADSGPAMRDLARSAKATGGQAKTAAENVLDARQTGGATVDQQGNPVTYSSHYDRMSEATRRALQVTRDNMVRTEDNLEAGRDAASDAAYTAFRNWGGRIPIDDILNDHANEMAAALPSTSDIAKTAQAARDLFSDSRVMATNPQTGVPLVGKTNYLTAEQFDAAKKQLDDMIGVAVRGGENYKASVLTDLKNRLVARADQATTVNTGSGNTGGIAGQSGMNMGGYATGAQRSLYANARDAYATPSQTLDAMEAGNNFRDVHPDRLAGEYGALNTAQRRAYRIGAADDLTQAYGDAQPGHNVTKFIDTPNMQNRLGELASGARLDKLNQLAAIEDQMKKTQNRVLGGSLTDENRIQSEDFTLATRIGDRLRQGHFLGAVTESVMGLLSNVYRFRELDAQMLARDLLSADPAQKAATIARLSARYGQGQVNQAVNQSLRMIGTQTGADTGGQLQNRNRNALGAMAAQNVP